METSPNSFSTKAKRVCGLFFSKWLINVVFPAPRKPVITVTGIMFCLYTGSKIVFQSWIIIKYVIHSIQKKETVCVGIPRCISSIKQVPARWDSSLLSLIKQSPARGDSSLISSIKQSPARWDSSLCSEWQALQPTRGKKNGRQSHPFFSSFFQGLSFRRSERLRNLSLWSRNNFEL